jgi:hypothetical protein
VNGQSPYANVSSRCSRVAVRVRVGVGVGVGGYCDISTSSSIPLYIETYILYISIPYSISILYIFYLYSINSILFTEMYISTELYHL